MTKTFMPKINPVQPRAKVSKPKLNSSMKGFMRAENAGVKFVKKHGYKTLSKDWYNEAIREESGSHVKKFWADYNRRYILCKHINQENGTYTVEAHTLRKTGFVDTINDKDILSYLMTPATKKMKREIALDRQAGVKVKQKYVTEVLNISNEIIDIVIGEEKILSSDEYKNDVKAYNRHRDFHTHFNSQLSVIYKSFVKRAVQHFNSIKEEMDIYAVTYNKSIEIKPNRHWDLRSNVVVKIGDTSFITNAIDLLDGKNDDMIYNALKEGTGEFLFPSSVALARSRRQYRERQSRLNKGKTVSPATVVVDKKEQLNFVMVANKADNKVLCVLVDKTANLEQIVASNPKSKADLDKGNNFEIIETVSFNRNDVDSNKALHALCEKHKGVMGKYVNPSRYDVLRKNKVVENNLVIKKFFASTTSFNNINVKLEKRDYKHKKFISRVTSDLIENLNDETVIKSLQASKKAFIEFDKNKVILHIKVKEDDIIAKDIHETLCSFNFQNRNVAISDNTSEI